MSERPENYETQVHSRMNGGQVRLEHTSAPEDREAGGPIFLKSHGYYSVDQTIELIDKLYEFVQYYTQEEET